MRFCDLTQYSVADISFQINTLLCYTLSIGIGYWYH